MVAEEQFPIKVDVGISAKAEVKTEIPKESSGRLVDALTDIIRPFSEKRGLRADQVRLQREDVLLEIAKRARNRLELEGKLPQPIPNKFLVPFMEKASLEDLDNTEIVDVWATLLASASAQFDEQMVRFVSVLAEMGPRQAKFLDLLANNKIEGYGIINGWEDAPLTVSDLSIENHFRAEFDSKNPSAYLTDMKKEFDRPGSLLISAVLTNYDEDFWDEFQVDGLFGDDWGYDELYVLDSLALVRFAQNTNFTWGGWRFSCSYVVLTGFGMAFYNACTDAPNIKDLGIL